MNKNKTPNCAVCKWMLKQEYIYPFPDNYYCTAQGHKEIKEVYNNDLCQKLFELK